MAVDSVITSASIVYGSIPAGVGSGPPGASSVTVIGAGVHDLTALGLPNGPELTFELVASGGGGAGAPVSGAHGGGGGGGGSYVIVRGTLADLGTTPTLTIGDKGAGGDPEASGFNGLPLTIENAGGTLVTVDSGRKGLSDGGQGGNGGGAPTVATLTLVAWRAGTKGVTSSAANGGAGGAAGGPGYSVGGAGGTGTSGAGAAATSVGAGGGGAAAPAGSGGDGAVGHAVISWTA